MASKLNALNKGTVIALLWTLGHQVCTC